MTGSISTTRRITEPFLKGHLALWLVEAGARTLSVSVDGAEPDADEIRRVLEAGGFTHVRSARSVTSYAGVYRSTSAEVTVTAVPGPDVIAELADGRRVLAECKGEKTAAGVRSGTDWSGFCEVLGQLLMACGALNPPPIPLLVVPATDRVMRFAVRASENRLLASIGVRVAVVDDKGALVFAGESL